MRDSRPFSPGTCDPSQRNHDLIAVCQESPDMSADWRSRARYRCEGRIRGHEAGKPALPLRAGRERAIAMQACRLCRIDLVGVGSKDRNLHILDNEIASAASFPSILLAGSTSANSKPRRTKRSKLDADEESNLNAIDRMPRCYRTARVCAVNSDALTTRLRPAAFAA